MKFVLTAFKIIFLICIIIIKENIGFTVTVYAVKNEITTKKYENYGVLDNYLVNEHDIDSFSNDNLNSIENFEEMKNLYLDRFTYRRAVRSFYIPIDFIENKAYINISVGSNKVMKKLMISTGSFNTWLFECDSSNNNSNNNNNVLSAESIFCALGNSTSWKQKNINYFASFYSLNVTGEVFSDNFSISNYSVPMDFALVPNNASFGNFSSQIDGILGLAASYTNTTALSEHPILSSLINELYYENHISARIFGIDLIPSYLSNDLNSSSLSIGSFDSSRYVNSLTYIDMYSDMSLWEFQIEDVIVGSIPLGLQSRVGIIDTASHSIFMPLYDAYSIISEIEDARLQNDTFYVPCNTTFTLTIVIGGSQWHISRDSWIDEEVGNNLCKTKLFGLKTARNNIWFLGYPFLYNVYCAFDMDANQIGLASKVYTPTASSSSTPISISTYSPYLYTIPWASSKSSDSSIKNAKTSSVTSTSSLSYAYFSFVLFFCSFLPLTIMYL